MFSRMLFRFVLSLPLAAATLVPMTATSFAGGGTGKVVTYHLNAVVAGRGSCIRTSPPLSGNGWGCVWYNNQLYREMNDLLRDAYVAGKTCTIVISTLDDNGNGIIDLAECD